MATEVPATVGILALHGDVAEHWQVFASLGVAAREVRTVADLVDVTHLVIPGGESTVIGRLLTDTGLRATITERAGSGDLAVFGTCAGLILLAQTVEGERPPDSLGLLDITVERNAYGSQLDSFDASLTVAGGESAVPVAFIRAPVITRIGAGVEVLATHGDQPVVVRQGRRLGSACHPEVRGEAVLHRLFLQM